MRTLKFTALGALVAAVAFATSVAVAQQERQNDVKKQAYSLILKKIKVAATNAEGKAWHTGRQYSPVRLARVTFTDGLLSCRRQCAPGAGRGRREAMRRPLLFDGNDVAAWW